MAALQKGYVKRRSEKSGLPPGSPVYVGERKTEDVTITVFDYASDRAETKIIQNIEDLRAYRDSPTVSWINVEGLHESGIVAQIGNIFGLHPLVIEDVLNSEQRTKIDIFDNYFVVIIRAFSFDKTALEVSSEQVGIVVSERFVITFKERRMDIFDHIRNRIGTEGSHIRKEGADYLAYAIMDAAVDSCFGVMEGISEQIEILEERLVKNPRAETLQRIHSIRTEAVRFMRSLWPLRNVMNSLVHAEIPVIKSTTRLYIRDLHDHVVQVLETAETLRELSIGLMDIYLSSMSNRMNEVMKVLTIWATIFIPLTFIVGLYGMNFKFMPELEWRYGYYFVLGVMAAIGAGMLIYFRRKRWF